MNKMLQLHVLDLLERIYQSNRIGRGRSYVKNGSVLDLKIKEGEVYALVQGSGSKPYNVVISIDKLDKTKWKKVTEICNHKIDTMETLLAGKFLKEFDEMFSASKNGLVPSPKEIHFKCSCPDSARMCKHIAAVLYGVGERLDEDPILFFKLRDVGFQELLKKSISLLFSLSLPTTKTAALKVFLVPL